MTCIKINGILCLANINFHCPKCKKKYSDKNDKYLDIINLKGAAKVDCDCGQSFMLTFNYMGDFVIFI